MKNLGARYQQEGRNYQFLSAGNPCPTCHRPIPADILPEVQAEIKKSADAILAAGKEKQAPLMVNSFYIIDDEKQRGKMTEEFYAAVKKEIAEYQERADYFIQSGCQSPAVMERWALKIQGLEERKRHYEQVLRRELDGLDDEFSTLKFMGQELQNRAKNIRFQKAA